MFVKLLILALIILTLSAIFLGIRILLKSNGKFPETHISRNRNMQKLGITCAQDTDIGCTPSDKFEGCATCGKRII